jgi:hypothetical protein
MIAETIFSRAHALNADAKLSDVISYLEMMAGDCDHLARALERHSRNLEHSSSDRSVLHRLSAVLRDAHTASAAALAKLPSRFK